MPVVAVQANRRVGLEQLKPRWPKPRRRASAAARRIRFRPRFNEHARELAAWLNAIAPQPLPHFLVERLLLDGDGYLEGELLNGDATRRRAKLRAARESLAAAGMPVPAVEAMARYDWVARTLDGIVRRPERSTSRTTSDRIDAVLTHKLGAR